MAGQHQTSVGALSRLNRAWRLPMARWRLSPAQAVPFLFVIALATMAAFAPLLAPHSPLDANLAAPYRPPAWTSKGDSTHILGTDKFGRDILSRVMHGSRVSLMVAGLVVVVAGTVGTTIGMLSAYLGGTVDMVLMRAVDIVLALPLILIAIVLAAVLGASVWNIVLVVALMTWPRYARQIRGDSLPVTREQYFDAARAIGCSAPRLILRHLLPNVVPTIIVLVTLQTGSIITLEATLSFLGIGVPAPTPAWGLMVAEGKTKMETAWWVSVAPGIALVLTVMCFNWIGDWLRDRLDPQLRNVGR